jgi:hypothetical protein
MAASLNLQGAHVEGYSVAVRVFLCVCEGKTAAARLAARERGTDCNAKAERE